MVRWAWCAVAGLVGLVFSPGVDGARPLVIISVEPFKMFGFQLVESVRADTRNKMNADSACLHRRYMAGVLLAA
jgi:hypothetical protein